METGKEAWPSPLPQYEFYKQSKERDNGQGSLKGNSFGSISGAIFT